MDREIKYCDSCRAWSVAFNFLRPGACQDNEAWVRRCAQVPLIFCIDRRIVLTCGWPLSDQLAGIFVPSHCDSYPAHLSGEIAHGDAIVEVNGRFVCLCQVQWPAHLQQYWTHSFSLPQVDTNST